MSFLKHLNEQFVQTDDVLFESIIGDDALDYLDEAIEKFGDLPTGMKKAFTRPNMSSIPMGGENSEIEVKSSGAIKNKTALNKVIRGALDDSAENSGVVIEANDLPIIAITRTVDNKYHLYAADGNMKKIIRSKYVRGGAITKARWDKWEDRYFNISESVAEVTQAIITAAGGDVEELSIDEALKELTITVKIVRGDKNREQLRTARGDNKAERRANSGLTASRRAAIKKYTRENLKPLIDDLSASIPKITDVDDMIARVIDGEKFEFDVKGIEEKLDDLNRVLRYFDEAYKSGKIKNSYHKELDWDIARVADILKKYKA